MIHLCTGATEGYPWLDGYVASVMRHVPVNVQMKGAAGPAIEFQPRVFLCGFKNALWRYEHAGTNRILHGLHVPVPGNRCKSLQHGAFLDALNAGSPRDMVIFTDADMVMQRPFTYDELYDFHFTGKDEVWLGVNGKEGDTLLEEARLLEASSVNRKDHAIFDSWIFEQMFPGWRELPVWNCGVLVCRVETYRRLHDMARALLPVVESVFEHYAAIQWCLCYCIGRWLKHRLLPRTIHVHGHFGLPQDCFFDGEGRVRIGGGARGAGREEEGELAVFRHCLNLTPEKGPGPENVSTAETAAPPAEAARKLR
jgi:hypothetical protein